MFPNSHLNTLLIRSRRGLYGALHGEKILPVLRELLEDVTLAPQQDRARNKLTQYKFSYKTQSNATQNVQPPHLPFAKWARAVSASLLVLTHCSHLTANSRLALPDASQFHWYYKSFYQQPTGRSKVTSVSSRTSEQQCTRSFHGGQAERSGNHSLQGRVPLVLEADLSASPADSILNSLSGWNIQEALEE